MNASQSPQDDRTAASGDDRDILTTKQAAALVGVDRHTLYRLAREGKISVIKIGPETWRFIRSTLLAELAAMGEGARQ